MQFEAQRSTESLIYWIGLATAIAQAVLGILMTCGVVTADLSGSIMTAFAVIAAWANGNNPNIAGTYNVYTAVESAVRNEDDDICVDVDSTDEPA